MPRKTRRGAIDGVGALYASMRPRPDAAENAPAFHLTKFPAAGFNEAAARCRGKRGAGQGSVLPRLPASMRPRPDAAENSPAAHPRGRIATSLQ